MQEWYLGWEKVSCLERCPQFRSVLIEREVPLYSHTHTHTHTHHCRRQLEKHAIFGVNNAELRFRVQYYVTSVTKLEFEVTR